MQRMQAPGPTYVQKGQGDTEKGRGVGRAVGPLPGLENESDRGVREKSHGKQ